MSYNNGLVGLNNKSNFSSRFDDSTTSTSCSSDSKYCSTTKIVFTISSLFFKQQFKALIYYVYISFNQFKHNRPRDGGNVM